MYGPICEELGLSLNSLHVGHMLKSGRNRVYSERVDKTCLDNNYKLYNILHATVLL